MTSRTPMGAQPRPRQRSVSSSSLAAQRPPVQRSLSQQYLPTSPARREGLADLNSDSNDAQNRYTSTPRRGGSRLKLELSNDAYIDPASATASPQTLTPSRLPPSSDPIDMNMNHTSPAMSRISQQDFDNPPLPMPKRRPQMSHQPSIPPRTTQASSAPAKKDSRPKPYTVEIPPAAPRYYTPKDTSGRGPADPFSKGLASGFADFFPWNNNHHEDEWTSEAIQKGTWDKINNSPKNASAKPSIFPALKQKSGLNALSTIFMGVLSQRRHRGQINVPSTFKPPPRVTLTDTKRELWLKDLASPAISLRRLSRTIPHGIRGRTLLDQCLNKNVPIERAVWLAKCVGANEIRAFKRKGVNGAFVMGGELKWARDWTVFVEQFVDAVLSAFGEAEWKAKVTYAIRLATNLYSEHLLDRDHYLDWIISGLEHCTQSKMPMWIIVAQIYWLDLVGSRKYGRRLVFALLAHLQTIHNDADREILIQLSNKLSSLLYSLMMGSSESFICPNVWPKYRDTLNAFLAPDDEKAIKAFNNINQRNSWLLVASTASPAGRQQLVRLLDATLQHHYDRELASGCWKTNDNKSSVAQTVVEWATSFHRPGLAKVYIAARLIREWSTLRVNVTSPILEILDSVAIEDKNRKNLVYHLVMELCRTGHFSISLYMNWLMARGGYHDAAEIDAEEGPCSGRLLVELPIHALSEKVRIERGGLLRRAGNYSVASEQEDISNAIRCVNHTLGLFLPPNDPNDPFLHKKPMSLQKLLRRLGHSSKALQSCVGAHLRDAVTKLDHSKDQFPSTSKLFKSIRSVLEYTQDFSMLSDIIQAFTGTSDPDVLAASADTTCANLPIFYAIGSADTLFNSLVDRFRVVSMQHGVAPRQLLASLVNLAQRMTGREDVANQLCHELLQSDRNNAIDACSPVSDNMAVQSSSAEGEIADEIDKLLSSGTSLDNPTMNRIFRNIIPCLENGWRKKDESRRVFSTLLGKVRVFDTQHFDKLMKDWTSHLRSMPLRSSLSDLLPLLINAGCLSIATITATASPLSHSPGPQSKTDQHGPATYLQELLQMLMMPLSTETGLSPDEVYRFHIEQKFAQVEQPKGILDLIRNALREYAELKAQNRATNLPLDNPACQDKLLESLRLLVLMDPGAASNSLNLKTLPTDAVSLIKQVTTRLLIPLDHGETELSFDRILGLANELTLPFCQLKLNLDLSLSNLTAASEGNDGPSRFELFAKAMDRAIEARNIVWTSMLPCLSEDITQHLKSQAQNGFLDLIPSTKAENPTDTISDQTIHTAENFLGVVEAIIAGQPPPKAPQLTSTMTEKLADMWDIVAANDQGRFELQGVVLKHWLPMMLRFVTLHSLSTEPPSPPLGTASTTKSPIPPSQDIRARIVLVLCGILLELATLPPATVGLLPQQVFDIAVVIADALPEDLRTQCAKTILPTPGAAPSMGASSDSRLYYIFSSPRPSPTDTLMLSHRESGAPHQNMSRGMGALYGIGPPPQERLSPFVLRRWEMLSEPTPNVGENDTSLSLGLFEAIKIK